MAEIKELIGEQPGVLDRELRDEKLFADFDDERIGFVCRLNIGNHPTFKDEEFSP